MEAMKILGRNFYKEITMENYRLTKVKQRIKLCFPSTRCCKIEIKERVACTKNKNKILNIKEKRY